MRRLFLIALVFLAGCSTMKNLLDLIVPTRTTLQTLRVVAEADANRNLPTRLDILFVYDGALLAQLPKIGPDWFRQKAALQAAWPTQMDVVALEVPPLSEATPALPKRYDKAVAVLAYADYLAAAGQPVLNLTPLSGVLITLQPEAIAVAAAPE
jgi:type VI secretion system protein